MWFSETLRDKQRTNFFGRQKRFSRYDIDNRLNTELLSQGVLQSACPLIRFYIYILHPLFFLNYSLFWDKFNLEPFSVGDH